MRALIGIAAVLALAACGEADVATETAELRAMDVGGEPPPPADAPAMSPKVEFEPSAGASGDIPVSLPRIAYTYGYTFRIPADEIGEVQERHVELCRGLGPARCRVVSLERDAASGNYATAATTLQVAAAIAPRFGDRLVAAAAEEGADTVAKSIAGEDLSRQMVDTEARIRTREALIRRLTELLETRSGNIQQAVEAERAINTAQEELDAARGWLAEMRTRVAMSTFAIRYESRAPLAGGVGDPIRDAFGEVGSIFAQSLAVLILLFGAILPWAAIGLLVWFGVRAWRRRRGDAADEPFTPAEEEQPPPAA